MADNVIVRVPEQQFIRGEDGYSPEVTIENIDHGHRITITDREYPEGQTADVLDGDSAYEQAVEGGYTGTEAQFNEELANFKGLSEQAASASFTAQYYMNSAWNAVNSANLAKVSAESAAQQALIRMNSADASAQTAEDASSFFTSTILPNAVNTINSTRDQAVANVNVAKSTAVQNVQAEGATQISAVQTESTTQQAAIQQKGEDVLDSIPADYTELSEDVADLKSATSAASKVEYLMIPYAISSVGNTKYIVREDGGHCAVFNVNQNTDYTVVVSGNNNRFRFYGLNEEQPLTEHYDYRTNLDGIIADTSTDSSIDSKTTYTINSGNFRAVVVYLGAELSDFSATLEITPALGSSFVISNSFLPDTLLKSAYSGRVHPFVVPAFEPYGDWKDYTSDQLIANVYEPLRASNPYYISRSVIGKDASGTYDIYQYTFEPDYYEQTIYLQSGVHARETDAYITLAKMMQMICNDYEGNEELSYLRFGCKIVVVPIVNVWGVSSAPYGSRGDVNANGKNLNRDLRPTLRPVYNGQAETIAVKNLVRQIMETDTISFALDLHTTTNNSYGDYMLTVWTGSKNETIAKRALYMLARMNATRRLSSYLTEYNLNQYELRLPYVGDSDNAGTYAEWFNTLGIPCATVEHSDYVFDTERCTVTTTSLCLQNFFTQLINHAEAKFPILMKP